MIMYAIFKKTSRTKKKNAENGRKKKERKKERKKTQSNVKMGDSVDGVKKFQFLHYVRN